MIEAQKKINSWCEALSGKTTEAAITGGIPEKITAIANSAQEQQLVVPVVGSFNAGKSTMINNLIGEEILPVEIKPETALATELHYSLENFIEAVKENGEIELYQINAIDTVQKKAEIDKVQKKAKDYLYARLYLNNARLREIEPLVLVDMPGFDSSIEYHNKAIMAYIGRGCYYIVLSNAEKGTITESLKRKLQEIEGYGREFSFFLSKENKRSKDEIPALVKQCQDQINDSYESKTKVVPFGTSTEEVLRCLKSIDINKVFMKIYQGLLLETCSDIIDSINLQINASKRNADEIRKAVKKLEQSIEDFSKKKSSDIEDMKRRYSVTMVNDLVSDVGRALDSSLEELAGIAVTGNKDELNRHFNDIVRVALTTSIQEKLNDINRQIAVDLSEALKDIDRIMKDLELDANYLKNITEKVETFLKMLDGIISRTGDSPITGVPLPGKGALDMGFKAVAGAGLAATKVNPIIGIAIMLLPNIIELFVKLFGGDPKEKQKEAVRSKLTGEVFPAIKRKIREEIPGKLNEQIEGMIKIASEKYEELLKNQRDDINSQIAQKSGNIEENEARQNKLNLILSDVKKIDSEIRVWGE